ncbi:shikimate dehydrogenase [Bacillus carboniphilus]
MEKIYGVIGNPIKHSLSPLIHNQAFSLNDIEARYHAFKVEKEFLGAAVQGMRALGIGGFNVTIPHKEAVMDFLDDVDPLAKQIGAVNTVVQKDHKLVGYNTDGIGFVKGMRETISDSEIENKKVLIIGSGGAAKAIYFTLLTEGFIHVDITNRSLSRAQNLIFECPHPTSNQSNALSLSEAESQLQSYEILIQTTSVGMSPEVDVAPIKLDKVQSGTFVYDIIYNPFETKLLVKAKEKGCLTHNGLDMFIYQAAYAFQLWTGVWPNTTIMKKTLVEHLGGS